MLQLSYYTKGLALPWAFLGHCDQSRSALTLNVNVASLETSTALRNMLTSLLGLGAAWEALVGSCGEVSFSRTGTQRLMSVSCVSLLAMAAGCAIAHVVCLCLLQTFVQSATTAVSSEQKAIHFATLAPLVVV